MGQKLAEALVNVHKIKADAEIVHQDYVEALADLVKQLQAKDTFKKQIVEKINKKMEEIHVLEKSRKSEEEK